MKTGWSGECILGSALTISGTGTHVTVSVPNESWGLSSSGGDITISEASVLVKCDGSSYGAVHIYTPNTAGKITLSTGTYFSNVNEYCAPGYVARQLAEGEEHAGYYKVEPITVDETTLNNAETNISYAVDEVSTTSKADSSIKNEDKQKAEEIAKSVAEEGSSLATAASEYKLSTEEKQTAIQTLAKLDKIKINENKQIVPPDSSSSSEDVTITLTKEPYLDVEVTSFKVDTSATGTAKELALNITPKYDLKATVKIGDGTGDTVTVSTGNKLEVTAPTELKIQLPDGFAGAGSRLKVEHTKLPHNETYIGTVSMGDDDKTYITFTTNGFSPFTIYAAASIGVTMYPTLQEAVAAASSGNTIKLESDCYEAVDVSGKSLTIDRNGKSYNFENVTVDNNSTKTVSADGKTLSIVYTAPSRDSSDGPTAYPVTAESAANGSVTTNLRSASKGDTVTLTVKPDAG